MPQSSSKKKKPLPRNEVKFVIRGSKGPVYLNGLTDDLYGDDHVAILNPHEIPEVAKDFLTFVVSHENPITRLAIVCPPGEPVDIRPILDVLPKLYKVVTPDASIHLHGAFLSGELFDRLLVQWFDVNLVGCALYKGWADPPKSERRCWRLWIEKCCFEGDADTKIGQCSWPELEFAIFSEGTWEEETGDSLQEDETRQPSPFPTSIEPFVKAIHSNAIKILSLFDSGDLSFLQDLPSIEEMWDFSLTDCACTPEILTWVSNQPNLRELFLSWEADVRLPWEKLRLLKQLDFLSVCYTPFDDRDLASVASTLRLKKLDFWETMTTPYSWPKVLGMAGLEVVGVSENMLEGKLSVQLPPETTLKRIITMNVGQKHVDYLRPIIQKYPQVEIYEM